MRHLTEHWYHEQFRLWWGIIGAYIGCAQDAILERVVYPAFLSTLPWPRWHPWVGREWSLLQVQLVTCRWLVGDLWSCWWLLVLQMTVYQMTLGFRWIVVPSSSRSSDPVPWDAQPDQSCSHHSHHSMFIFKKIMHEKQRKKLTRMCISFSGSFMIK